MSAATSTDLLYQAFRTAEGSVVGGEGCVGIYGTLTKKGTSAVMQVMAKSTGLGPSSVLVDIGAGLCRPLLHARLQLGVEQLYGVELDPIKCQKAVSFIGRVEREMAEQRAPFSTAGLLKVICAPIEQVTSLEPATHIYSAWEGFSQCSKQAVAELFVNTQSVHAIAIVQRHIKGQDPCEYMAELGFGPLTCVGCAIPVTQAGSGRRLNAYVFVKAEASKPATRSAKRKAGFKTGASKTTEGISLVDAAPFATA